MALSWEGFIVTYVAPTQRAAAYWIGWSIISWRAKRTGGAP